MRDLTQLDNWFRYHLVTSETKPLHEQVRAQMLHVAQQIEALTPDGVEQDQALIHLRMAMYWANAAIAVNLAPLEKE